MTQNVEITRQELKKLSLDLRNKASRLLKTDFKEGISNLKRFVNFIEKSPIINDFIKKTFQRVLIVMMILILINI